MLVVLVWSSLYDGIISDFIPLGKSDTSETPHFKGWWSSLIFFWQAPAFTIGNMWALYNPIFRCLHILLDQTFCFNVTKAYVANEIWYLIYVWMFGTILPRYLNVCTCSIGKPSTSMLLLHSDKSLFLLSFIFMLHFLVASLSSPVEFLSLSNSHDMITVSSVYFSCTDI